MVSLGCLAIFRQQFCNLHFVPNKKKTFQTFIRIDGCSTSRSRLASNSNVRSRALDDCELSSTLETTLVIAWPDRFKHMKGKLLHLQF